MKKYLALILSLAFLSFGSELEVKAENMGAISVDPVTGVNQKEGVRSYLHNIIDTENYSEKLEFNVTSKSKEEVKVKVYPVNALTSTTGAVDYRPELETDHSKLLDESKAFTDYASIESELIILKPGESKRVFMDVNIDKLKGTILGGLAFQSLADVETREEGNTQFKINHEVTNVVAVLITNDDKSYSPIEFGEVFLRPSPSYYNIVLPAKNKADNLIVNSDLTYVVKDKSGKPLFKSPENSKFNFAPNTEVNINLPWNSDKMTEGEIYTITGEFNHLVNGNVTTEPFSKTFKYDKKITADTGSFSEPVIVKEGLDWKQILIFAIPVLLLILIILLVILLKPKKYMRYSEDIQTPEIIEPESELYSRVYKYRKGSGSSKTYKHIYKKKGNTYIYITTLINK